LHETGDREVAGAVNEGFVLGRVEHHLYTTLRAQTLETEHGLRVGRETNAPIAWRADKEYDGLAHYKTLGQGF
jgi:hypothetical protein